MNLKDVFRKFFNQRKLIESEVDEEMARILNLTIEDAKNNFNRISLDSDDDLQINENSDGSLPDNFQLDEVTREFFRRYRSIYLFESDTKFSMNTVGVDSNKLIIGESKADGFIYFIKPLSSEVFEDNNGKIMESFPSIYHLILILLPSFEL